MLRGVKNRFGSTDEVGVFEMTQEGMREVLNPSQVFLAERSAGTPGSIGPLPGTSQYSAQTLSLDEWVARDLRSRGILTQVPSIHLGGVSGQPGLRFVNNGLQVPTFSLTQAFSNVFDGAAPAAPPPPATGGGTTPAPTGPSPAELRLRRRQSILDLVTGEIKQLQGSLGNIEKQKLELHLESIQQLEQRIKQQLDAATGTVSTGGDTTGGGAPVTFIQPVSCQQPGNLASGLQPIENSTAHLDIAVAAFACDITRVALVEFGHHQSCPVSIPNAQGDWHNDFMHAQGAPRTKLIATEQYMSQRIVDLVGKLKATPAPGGGGTLFDQTYVLWAREMGDAVVHAGNNMPFVITGKAGGYLRNGNGYLSGGGAAHTQVLASAAEAMGATNLSTLGGPGKAAGDQVPFPGLRA